MRFGTHTEVDILHRPFACSGRERRRAEHVCRRSSVLMCLSSFVFFLHVLLGLSVFAHMSIKCPSKSICVLPVLIKQLIAFAASVSAVSQPL